MSEQMGNLKRAMETVKKNQMYHIGDSRRKNL